MARYPGNFTDSDVLNVPRNLRVRPDTPMVELAYVTPKEQGILQALKPGTPHKGPMGIPNYDELDYLPPATTGGSWTNTPGGGVQTSGGGSTWNTGASPPGPITLPDPDPPGAFGGMTQAQQDAYQAAQSMAAAGVTGLGGGQQQPGAQGSFTLTDPSTGQTNTYTTNQAGTTFTTNPQGQTTHINGAPIEPSGILPDINLNVGEAWQNVTNPLIQVLGSLQGKDRLLKKLASGEGLSDTDKIVLASLMASEKEGKNVFGNLEDYTTENVDLASLGERLLKEKSGIDQKYFEALQSIDEYKTGKPTGLGGILGIGEGRTGEGPTLEELKEDLGPVGIALLKDADPKAYYSFTDPQTSGGLEELASQSLQGLTNSPEDRQYAAKIIAAREATSGKGGGGGGQGIADLSPVAQLAATTPEEVAATPEEVAAATTTTPAATTTAMTTPTPFDYSQWPQCTSAYPGYNQYPGPNYVNQGLGQWPDFDYWNQIANAYPGMGNYG